MTCFARWRRRVRTPGVKGSPPRAFLLYANDDAGADGLAALTNREPHPGFDPDGLVKLERDLGVVSRGDLQRPAPEAHERSGDVGRSEKELGPVAGGDRRVPSTFLLRDHEQFGLGLGPRFYRAWRDEHLTTNHFVAADAAQKQAAVLSGTGLR